MEMRLGYKRAGVGVIPEEWESSAIGDFAYVTKLAGFEYTSHFDYSQSGPIIAIRALNIKNGALDLTEVHTIPKKTSDALPRSKLVEGDLVISYVGTLGRVALIPESGKFHLAPNVAKISVDKKTVSPEFLAQFLNSFQGQKNILEAAASTTQAALSMRNLRQILFCRPPLLEQCAIAKALCDVDSMIGTLDALIAKKRDLKQAAMQQLLTGKRRLPGFKGEWEAKTLPEVSWFQEGPGVRNYQFASSGVKLLNGTNIENGKLNLDSTDRYVSNHEAYGVYSHFLADDGDIVIASSGITVERFHEKVAFVNSTHLPLCMNTSTIRFKIISKDLKRDFLFYFLKSKSFKQQIGGQATGSAQLNFGPSHVKKVLISLPKPEEQTAIATVLSDMDVEIAALEQRRDKTCALKQGMMQDLLTGKTRLK